jgi:hypothetical protein
MKQGIQVKMKAIEVKGRSVFGPKARRNSWLFGIPMRAPWRGDAIILLPAIIQTKHIKK